MWYIYDFARKAWADAFTNAKSLPELAEKPIRFRDFPKVNKEYCIGCGACFDVCEHNAREFNDDTERFFADLKRGEKISILLAPAFKANYPNEYESVPKIKLYFSSK